MSSAAEDQRKARVIAEAEGEEEEEDDNGNGRRRRRRSSIIRRVVYVLFLLLLLAGVTAVILYLIYRPTHPTFSVSTFAIYSLTINTTTTILTTVQPTLLIHNPNPRASISYDRLVTFLTYHGRPITPPARLPPVGQAARMTVSVAPLLGGAAVAVPEEVGNGVRREERVGVVAVTVVVMGRVRYRPGPFRSGWYGLHVACDVLVGVRQGVFGQVPLLASPECRVDV